MRKIFKILILSLLIFTLNINTDAKTLADLKNELAQLEQKKKDADNKKNLTQAEINKVSDRMDQISANVDKSEKKIKELDEEIIVLEKKAKEKEEEIKDIFSFLQVTSSENAYLEYIFGANSIEDLILRSAVSEQLVSYNDNLIEDYNDTVKAYRIKTEELKVEITNLEKEQDNLEVELVKLGDNLNSVIDITVDINSEISSQKKVIDYYQNTLGCKDNQDINTCGKVPFTGKLLRPVVNGRVTSLYGTRVDPITGKKGAFHSGIDMAPGTTDVYAAGPGRVSHIFWKETSGGTKLFIYHNVNGTTYTTAYFHLYKVLVSPGDYVDQNTKIAIMGGDPSLTPWDKRTTGRHLHFTVARGLYMTDYSTWSSFISHTVDPKTVVNFPGKGSWFYGRTKTY